MLQKKRKQVTARIQFGVTDWKRVNELIEVGFRLPRDGEKIQKNRKKKKTLEISMNLRNKFI